MRSKWKKLQCRFNSRGALWCADGKIKPALYSIYVLHSTSRWMLNCVSPIAMLSILQRRNSLPATNGVTSCNLTRAARSPTLLLQLIYVTSGPSLYSRGIISARRRREVREFVQLRANLHFSLLVTVLNKLFNTQGKRIV